MFSFIAAADKAPNVTISLFISLVNTLKDALSETVNAGHCETRLYCNSVIFAQAVRWLPTVEAGVEYRDRPCGICGGQTGTARGFSLSVLFHTCSM